MLQITISLLSADYDALHTGYDGLRAMGRYSWDYGGMPRQHRELKP